MDLVKSIHKALSDEDIHHILGRVCKIRKYSELARYQDLEEPRPNLLGCAVVLYAEQESSGHWVGFLSATAYSSSPTPYGLIPAKELSWVSPKAMRTLSESVPYLSNLLKGERYVYNRVKYQNLGSYVNTCGSHVVHRVYRLIHDNMCAHEYYEHMQKLRDAGNTSYDMSAASFTKPKLA